MTKQNPLSEAVTTALMTLGESDPVAWRSIVTKRRKRPDAIDRLADLLREDRVESRLLLNRIIDAVQEKPGLSRLATELSAWRAVPYVDVLFRGESSGGRPTDGPLVRFTKALDAFRVKAAREVLEKWDHLVPLGRSPEELRDFLLEEWKARRFPYTGEELATIGLVRPEVADEERAWPSLLPFFATALHRIQQKRDKAFTEKDDSRKAGVSTKRLAAWIVLSATGRANSAADVGRFLARIEKRVPPK